MATKLQSCKQCQTLYQVKVNRNVSALCKRCRRAHKRQQSANRQKQFRVRAKSRKAKLAEGRRLLEAEINKPTQDVDISMHSSTTDNFGIKDLE